LILADLAIFEYVETRIGTHHFADVRLDRDETGFDAAPPAVAVKR